MIIETVRSESAWSWTARSRSWAGASPSVCSRMRPGDAPLRVALQILITPWSPSLARVHAGVRSAGPPRLWVLTDGTQPFPPGDRAKHAASPGLPTAGNGGTPYGTSARAATVTVTPGGPGANSHGPAPRRRPDSRPPPSRRTCDDPAGDHRLRRFVRPHRRPLPSGIIACAVPAPQAHREWGRPADRLGRGRGAQRHARSGYIPGSAPYGQVSRPRTSSLPSHVARLRSVTHAPRVGRAVVAASAQADLLIVARTATRRGSARRAWARPPGSSSITPRVRFCWSGPGPAPDVATIPRRHIPLLHRATEPANLGHNDLMTSRRCVTGDHPGAGLASSASVYCMVMAALSRAGPDGLVPEVRGGRWVASQGGRAGRGRGTGRSGLAAARTAVWR